MSRREEHQDAMLRHLGAIYYQTLYGRATAADVAKAVESVTAEEESDGTSRPPGRWKPGRRGTGQRESPPAYRPVAGPRCHADGRHYRP